MKKKLLAVVLSVVMIAALLVPMMAISADTKPTATIYLGDPVAEGIFIKIPIYLSGNTGEMCGIEYKVYSIDKLEPLDVVKTGTMVDTFTNKLGELVPITFDAQGTAKYNPDDFDGYTGYKMLNDSSELNKGIKTEAGLIAEVYFAAPTVPKTYTFRVKGVSAAAFLEGAATKDDVEDYIITDGADVTYTLECKNHVAGDPIITEPTCTVAGSKVVNCSVCGAEMSDETIAAPGHTAGDPEVTKEATCTEKGEQVIKCTVCKEVIKTEEIAALDHDWDNGVVAEGVKCGETADTIFTCKREGCGETKKVTGAVVEHDMVADEENSKAPTCTEAGVEATKCAREGCDHKDSKPVAALGHTKGEFAETKAPTCTEAGEEVAKCTVCTEVVETREIKALGHDMVADEENSKAPTCTEAGVEATKCAREGCDHKDSKPVAALGHTEGEYEETKAPTCTEAGEEVAKCTVCGEVVDTNEIDPLGHDVDIEVVTVPTADAEGAYKLVCLVCGEVIEEGTLAKLTNVVEHKDADGNVVISFKADEPILPEDIMFFPVDMDEEGESIVIAFVSSIIEELEGKVEFAVTLDVEEKGTFKVTTMDADGKEVAVDVAYKDGVLSFEADLASEYTITFEEDKPVVNPDGDKSETEANGDTVNTVVFAVVALAAVAGLVVVGKKRLAL